MSQAINAGIATANQLNQVRETKGDSLGKSDFLLLLVTQFKHQDPLNPMDDKEFVAQLAQFSSLEQLMNMNESMDNLTAATKEQQLMNAANYIGKNVAASGNSIAKAEDGGISSFFWAIGEDMAKGSLYVYDQNMNQVYGENLSGRAAGTYSFDWDGKNYEGRDVLPGVYYIRLSIEDASGQPMLSDTAVTGRVTGVTTDNGETYLRLEDGRLIALKNVREIAAPPATDNDNAANNNGANTGETNTGETNTGETNTGGNTETGDETGTG